LYFCQTTQIGGGHAAGNHIANRAGAGKDQRGRRLPITQGFHVRTLLLTNCDVDENSPHPQFLPFIAEAKKETFVDRLLIPQLNDKQLARSAKGIVGLAYTNPEKLQDETIETYFRPLAETPLKEAQVSQYAASVETNLLVAIRDELHRWKGPARMVWGLKDTLFGVEWAEWLNRTLPGSRGVRRLEEANLFFPEEMPDLIAEEAEKLWNLRRQASTATTWHVS
jgi:haloalkane dehalogenase